MRFIGDQDDVVFAKIFEGDGVFLVGGQVGVQFLDRGEADVDVVGIRAFKIIHRRYAHAAVADDKFLIEKIFDGGGVEKIIFRFFYDIGGIDKEQEVAIALLVEI